jgi:hypothetical protein
MDQIPPGSLVSVSWRLRRVTVEYAYVSVPVADDLVRPDDQGVNRLDAQAMARKAVEMGQSSEVVWYRAEQQVELHPLQKAPEPGEISHRG